VLLKKECACVAFMRLADVNTLARKQANPWPARYGFTNDSLDSIRAIEGWHDRYNLRLGSSPGAPASKHARGKV
jgi:hypothetical protein